VHRILINVDKIDDSRVVVEGPEVQHLVRVLRAKKGDEVVAFDGQGQQWTAQIEELDNNQVHLHLGETQKTSLESPLAITLGIGVTKGDKLDVMVRMATELGVQVISPLYTHRSVPSDMGDAKRQRLRRIALEACKQSRRNHLPQVNDPVALSSFLEGSDASSTRLILWEQEGTLLSETLQTPPPKKVSVLIGPEGGWEESEIKEAQEHGFQCIHLGPRILRTETAVAAVLSALQSSWGDL